MKKSESIIQEQLCYTLSVFSQKYGFLFFSVPNEGLLFGAGSDRKKAFGRMAKLKKMGLTPGVSDLVIVKAGMAYFLEIKADGGKQGPKQEAFEKRSRAVGAQYAVANSYNRAIEILKYWNIFS